MEKNYLWTPNTSQKSLLKNCNLGYVDNQDQRNDICMKQIKISLRQLAI
jgi:hypothetical protein